MRYKKWIISLTLIVIPFYLLFSFIYILIDPEQFFGNSLTQHKFRYTNYFSMHQYNKLKKNHYSLVFGTSRSMKISSKAQNIPLLNFHNLYGEPTEILNFLQQLNQKQKKNIDTIYFLVSINTMTTENKVLLDYSKQGFFYKLYAAFPLSIIKLKYILKDISLNMFSKKSDFYIEKDGSKYDYNKDIGVYIPTNEQTKVRTRDYKKKAISELIAIDKFCKKNNINIIYYTPTYTNQHLANFALPDLEIMWIELLDKGIHGFYALYYLEGISNQQKENFYPFFTDPSHLNYTMMNKVFKENLFLNKKNHYITTKNIDEYFNKNNNKKFQHQIRLQGHR